MIFPEGTRMAPGETRKYGASGAMLAAATGKLIVPVAHDSGYYWPRRGLMKKAGTIRVVIGPPIVAEGRDPRDVNARGAGMDRGTFASVALGLTQMNRAGVRMRRIWSVIAIATAGALLAACGQHNGATNAASTQPASGAATAAPPPAAPPDPQVTFSSGAVQGGVAGGVEFFKGIPYAAPPVGPLRWKPPQPPAHWDGVRDATAYAHDCMQQPFTYDAAPLRTTPSEDCLYLNIWRPAGARGLPVMVWIYGGGFVNGGTSPAAYDGSHLAAKGVVLVSFNYRLGRFGFFAFPALTAAHPHELLGNYGYMDQIAALKWVKANIADFGGDPDNVMVFGESAGGGSVHMLLTSALAAGLFNRAAVESGGGRANLMGDRQLSRSRPALPSGEAIGVNFARANGISGSGAAALAALRALPADKVCAGLGMMNMNPSGPPTYAGPMVDGHLVVRSPEAAYRSGRFAHVPLLIGANSADLGITNAKTMTQALAPFGADRHRALAAYDPDHSNDVHLVAARIASDSVMVEPARFDATEFAAHGVAAYEYRFSYVAPAAAAAQRTGPFAKMTVPGAQHASEIPYVFDTIAAVLGSSVTPEDQSTGEAASSYWANFAKTGNPSGGSLPAWPAYSPKSDELMNFTENGPTPMPDPWRARLDLTAKHAH